MGRYRVHLMRMVQQEDFIEVDVDESKLAPGVNPVDVASLQAIEDAPNSAKWDDVKVVTRRMSVADEAGVVLRRYKDSGELPI